jgi:16S rRNA (guanine527-N7)-methyltransferase
MVQRHYAESLEILRISLEAATTPNVLVDVGTGGGFPGLIMACVLPRTVCWLVEPLQKRARLLQSLAEALDLANVHVLARRAEEAGRGELRDAAELVTARAVAPLSEVLEYTAPLAATGGLIALPKGSALPAELASAGNALAELRCLLRETTPMRPAISGSIAVAIFGKVAATPSGYPRRPGSARKRPL